MSKSLYFDLAFEQQSLDFGLDYGEVHIVESYVKDHNLLDGRNDPDQHSIESITGLREELDSKSDIIMQRVAASNLLTVDESGEIIDSGVCCTDIITADSLNEELEHLKDGLVTSEALSETIESLKKELENNSNNSGTTSTVTDHSQLSGRDLEDQHPISAIKGLQELLDQKLDADSSVVLDEVDPTVPGWAKSPVKPEYDVSEIRGIEEYIKSIIASSIIDSFITVIHGGEAGTTIDQSDIGIIHGGDADGTT